MVDLDLASKNYQELQKLARKLREDLALTSSELPLNTSRAVLEGNIRRFRKGQTAPAVSKDPRALRARRIMEVVTKFPCLNGWTVDTDRPPLGVGTVGTVILVCKKDGGQCAAAKIQEFNSKQELETFDAELKTQKAFAAVAPKVYTSCLTKANGRLYGAIVMELLGEELDKYLSKPRGEKEIRHVGTSLERILKFEKKRRYTHGDLALFNVAFLKDSNRLVLLDFDRASTKVFAPEVDLFRLQLEMCESTRSKGTKKLDPGNMTRLSEYAGKWCEALGVEGGPKSSCRLADEAWLVAYEGYCREAGVKCLES